MKVIRNFFEVPNPEREIRETLPEIYPKLWRFSLTLTGSPSGADDLVQATALRAIEKAQHYKAGTHLDRWLFVLARRIWLNEKRSEHFRRAGGLVAVEEMDIPASEPEVETNILARQVFEKIMALPEAQRVTVLLVYVEGYSYREASELLEVPIGTVMSRLATARKTVQGSERVHRTASK